MYLLLCRGRKNHNIALSALYQPQLQSSHSDLQSHNDKSETKQNYLQFLCNNSKTINITNNLNQTKTIINNENKELLKQNIVI